MAEREQKRKPAPAREEQEETVEEAPATSETGEKIKAELDDLLGRDRRSPRDQRRGLRKSIRAEGRPIDRTDMRVVRPLRVRPHQYCRFAFPRRPTKRTDGREALHGLRGVQAPHRVLPGGRGRDGTRGDCKACFQWKRAERYASDPELQRIAEERTRKWQQDNPERYRAKQAAYRQTDAYKRQLRAFHLRTKHGITINEYDRMLEEQGSGCAICGRPPWDDISLHVDHDHESGRIRGLLCFCCNNGLGQFQDDPGLLLNALDYLTATGKGPPPQQERLF